jgi:hypothetical protein
MNVTDHHSLSFWINSRPLKKSGSCLPKFFDEANIKQGRIVATMSGEVEWLTEDFLIPVRRTYLARILIDRLSLREVRQGG